MHIITSENFTMPIVTLKELKARLPGGKRLMGIDHSRKSLGLAVSNPEQTLATPLKTIPRTKFSKDVLELCFLCKEYNVGGFVIGLPLNMDESEGPRVDSVRHFADNLLGAKDVFGFEPLIAFFDERLSTFAAEDLLNTHSRLKKSDRAGIVDKLAAQVMLQGAIEKMQKP